jgi:hypothetical protein
LGGIIRANALNIRLPCRDLVTLLSHRPFPLLPDQCISLRCLSTALMCIVRYPHCHLGRRLYYITTSSTSGSSLVLVTRVRCYHIWRAVLNEGLPGPARNGRIASIRPYDTVRNKGTARVPTLCMLWQVSALGLRPERLARAHRGVHRPFIASWPFQSCLLPLPTAQTSLPYRPFPALSVSVSHGRAPTVQASSFRKIENS